MLGPVTAEPAHWLLSQHLSAPRPVQRRRRSRPR